MWKQHDNYMKQLKQLYSKVSKQTQLRLQEIFDTFDFTSENIYDIADNRTKKRTNTYIENWKEQGLLKNNNYFSVLANSIYRRTRVKNSEIIELLIYSAYIEEQNKLKDQEQQIMYSDVNYYYQQGQKEVKNKKSFSVLEMALFLTLLEQQLYNGYTFNQNIEAIIKYNTQQIYKQYLLNVAQNKENDITDITYQKIIQRQQNTKLNINSDKISGNMDLIMIGLNNKAKAEGMYLFDKDAKVKFIAVQDDKTTKMCDSLDEQIFKVHGWNEFYRYSDTNKSKVKVKCFGLVYGLNLPPIDDGFHWCRSTTIYNTDLNNAELIAEYNNIKSLSNKISFAIPNNIDDFADLWYNKVGYSDELKLRRKVYMEYKEQQEIGKEGIKATFEKYYKNYLQTQSIDKIITKDNIEVGEIQPHTIYRLACRDLTVNDIKEILANSYGKLDKKHNSYLYTLDDKVFVSIANDKQHNVKTILKSRKGRKK